MDSKLISITVALLGGGLTASAYGNAAMLAAPEDGDKAPPADEPDYGAPGSSGDPIEGEPMRSGSLHVDRLLPTVGECDEESEPHTVMATTRQQVFACANYDHAPLYDRARKTAEALGSTMSCPEGCERLSWVSFHRWGCIDFIDPGIASASVEVSAQCAPEGTPAPESLPRPDDADLHGADIKEDGDKPKHAPAWYDEIGDTVDVPCNATELALFDLQVPVDSCNVMDYQLHVEEAVIRAQSYHSTIPCAGGCDRSNFETQRIEWSCQSIEGTPTVQVNVFFNVVCESP